MAAAAVSSRPRAQSNAFEFQRRAGGSAQNRSSTPAAKASAKTAGHSSACKLGAPTVGLQGAAKNVTNNKGVGALDEHVLRAGFLRKVYGLLTAQMVVTVVIAGACMVVPVIRTTLLSLSMAQPWWFRLAMWLPSATSLLALKLNEKSYPANLYLLAVFTLAMSIQVGLVCAVFQEAGHGYLVLQAFVATAVIFMGLSAYTLISGKNFSFIGGFLSVALWGLVLCGFLGIFFPHLVPSLAFGCVGALTFCGYILFDTWRLQKQFGYDDYIGATIELYLDIVNLFLYILEILASLSKKAKD